MDMGRDMGRDMGHGLGLFFLHYCRVWLILIFMPSLVVSTLINGFDLLDDFLEETSAGENVVFAETPFSPQVSVCQWVFPKRAIIESVGFSLFET